jgi:hypothetical protein
VDREPKSEEVGDWNDEQITQEGPVH